MKRARRAVRVAVPVNRRVRCRAADARPAVTVRKRVRKNVPHNQRTRNNQSLTLVRSGVAGAVVASKYAFHRSRHYR
jgi:hypothetical protein